MTTAAKKFIIDLKIIPYFKKKNMNEIKAWVMYGVWVWYNQINKSGYIEKS